jgi:hypothetical protein
MDRGKGGEEREGMEEWKERRWVKGGQKTYRYRDTIPELILGLFGEETDVFSFLWVWRKRKKGKD